LSLRLESNVSSALLVSTKFKVLASLDRLLSLVSAGCAFKSENNLLGSLGLLVENRLGLTSKTLLFSVVTSLSLSENGRLSDLVLGDLVRSVFLALFTWAEGLSSLWDVDHFL